MYDVPSTLLAPAKAPPPSGAACAATASSSSQQLITPAELAAGAQAPSLRAHYAAVFLTRESAEVLRAMLPPRHACVSADHMTLAYEPSAQKLAELPLGAEVFLEVSAQVCSQRCQAAAVVPPASLPATTSAAPHITLSCAPGVPAVEAGQLVAAAAAAAAASGPAGQWEVVYLPEPLLLVGLVGVRLSDGRTLSSRQALEAALRGPGMTAGAPKAAEAAALTETIGSSHRRSSSSSDCIVMDSSDQFGSAAASAATQAEWRSLVGLVGSQVGHAVLESCEGCVEDAISVLTGLLAEGMQAQGGGGQEAQHSGGSGQQQEASGGRTAAARAAAAAGSRAAKAAAKHKVSWAQLRGLMQDRAPAWTPEAAAPGGGSAAAGWAPQLAADPFLGAAPPGAPGAPRAWKQAVQKEPEAEETDEVALLARQHGVDVVSAECLICMFPSLEPAWLMRQLARHVGDLNAAAEAALQQLGAMPSAVEVPAGPSGAWAQMQATAISSAQCLAASCLAEAPGCVDGSDAAQAQLLSAFPHLDPILVACVLRQEGGDVAAAVATITQELELLTVGKEAAGSCSSSSNEMEERPAAAAPAAMSSEWRTVLSSRKAYQLALKRNNESSMTDGAVPGWYDDGRTPARPRRSAVTKRSAYLEASRARERAAVHTQAAFQFMSLSRVAYDAGNSKLAGELAAKQRHHQAQAKYFRALANDAAFHSSNLGIKNELTIDLHGMQREEALEQLDKRLELVAGLNMPQGVLLKVITGIGKHSAAGKPLIKLAVLDYLERLPSSRNASWKVDPENQGQVLVQVGGSR